MLDITIIESANKKTKPEADNPLVFGTIFTDHMFVMDYEAGKGWINPTIMPYQPLQLDPSTMVFHYGQEMFEGMKAYSVAEGRPRLFRPDRNMKRANATNERICIPTIPEEDFIQALKAIVTIDQEWIPTTEGTSLYIRPFIIATDTCLGVRPSNTYKFIIILSPVGAYYPEGLKPVKIWIEEEYVRAVRGGLGEAKAGANYAASLKAQEKAHAAGYSQVLWLDGVEQKYIEEVGAMNIFFKINGKVITPSLTGSILAGVTRQSCIELCESWGYTVEERKITAQELLEAGKNGTLEEVFGTGTAAVISPVGWLREKEEEIMVQDGGIGELSQRLYDTITGIQLGKIEGPKGWSVEI
ncbi:MAG: branched-chain amino acid aminotransferase [Eubacteriales bacterium]